MQSLARHHSERCCASSMMAAQQQVWCVWWHAFWLQLLHHDDVVQLQCSNALAVEHPRRHVAGVIHYALGDLLSFRAC